MKLRPIVFLVCLFTAAACHSSTRKDKKQVGIVKPGKSNLQTQSAPAKEKDSVIYPVWSSFVVLVKGGNLKALERVSMGSIIACDSVYLISHFLGQCFKNLFDSTLLAKMEDSNSIEFLDREETRSSFPSAVLRLTNVTDDDAITLKEIVVTKIAEEPDGPSMIAFDFIPTRKGYLFYSCSSYGGPRCCQ
jgi:hypothetical protein